MRLFLITALFFTNNFSSLCAIEESEDLLMNDQRNISKNLIEENNAIKKRDREQDLLDFYFPSLQIPLSQSHRLIIRNIPQQNEDIDSFINDGYFDSDNELAINITDLNFDEISDEGIIDEITKEIEKNQKKNSHLNQQAGLVLRETLPMGLGAGLGGVGYLGIKVATLFIPALAAGPAVIPFATGGVIACIGYGVSRLKGATFFEEIPQRYSFSDIIPRFLMPEEKKEESENINEK